MAPKILVVSSTGLPKAKIEELRAEVPGADIIVAEDTAQSIQANLDGLQALIGCPRPLFNAALLAKAQRTLRWIHVGGAGCEEFFIPELVESEVVLTNGRIIQGPEVADHALALLLTLTRNIQYVLRGMVKDMPRPIELRGKNAVVVGVGGVGMLVAERLHAFGMTVSGVDQEYIPMIRAIDRWYLPERLAEALSLADVAILCVPVTENTRKLFGKKEFSVMKESAYFINVCRGAVVDTEALTEALAQGKMKAAGLDVTDPEPLSENHPLRNMQNVVMTPHRAGLSDNNRDRGFELIKQNIERFIKGAPLINVVNKKMRY
ncbi:D-2-hydroxyacid dehydrogenase [Candidatus Uhrbacteria bacterium]|nr:D-2-hydroxyacid dehydrogenase [Candidatus Uhrbacteria bacterium]